MKLSKQEIFLILVVLGLSQAQTITEKEENSFSCEKILNAERDQDASDIFIDYYNKTEDLNTLSISQDYSLNIITLNTQIKLKVNPMIINRLEAEIAVKSAITQVQNKQDEIFKLFEGKTKRTLTISPAFEWAQSIDQIFINAKFAHRMNAPGCLDTYDHNITFTNDTLNMTVLCSHENLAKKYQLVIKFYGEIDPNNSTYEFNSVGRISFKLWKKFSGRWDRLLNSKKKEFKNMQTWWDMQDQLDPELNKHKSMDDSQVEGLQDWISSNRIREKETFENLKKESKKVNFKQYQLSSQRQKKDKLQQKAEVKSNGIWDYPPFSWLL
ncbi:UNKNOWN [Stylonychia lemnae]|uniref:CS domain-containing protein n=1 Tax=Stylonychia lemnae TaxID=5949 RepID=A0A078AED6_STYLE|nr:UNKNOWN [Stylonychia lemnae]|eukprot:CDW80565.1 UNKNOWN [Stylonychia lemnae]